MIDFKNYPLPDEYAWDDLPSLPYEPGIRKKVENAESTENLGWWYGWVEPSKYAGDGDKDEPVGPWAVKTNAYYAMSKTWAHCDTQHEAMAYLSNIFMMGLQDEQ